MNKIYKNDSKYICDCGEHHSDNPFCYFSHLKYNLVINSESGILDAAEVENVISSDEADSLRVSSTLSRSGNTSLHRELFSKYTNRVNIIADSLRNLGYTV